MREIRHLTLALASAVVVGVFATSAAHAEAAPTDTAGSFTILGKTFCFDDAPATVPCDVRFAPPAAQVVTLFGTTYCLGEAPGVKCDVTWAAAQQAQPRRDGSLSRWLQEFSTRLAGQVQTRAMN